MCSSGPRRGWQESPFPPRRSFARPSSAKSATPTSPSSKAIKRASSGSAWSRRALRRWCCGTSERSFRSVLTTRGMGSRCPCRAWSGGRVSSRSSSLTSPKRNARVCSEAPKRYGMRWPASPQERKHDGRRRTGRAAPSRGLLRPSPLRLEVRLDHPEPFVHAPRDLDEDVVGVLVVDAIALLDGAADELAERRQGGGEGIDVLPPAPDRQRVFGERRSLRDGPRRALDRSAELDGALGDQIDVVFDVLVHLVEQLMQGDEVRALHVPMRLLRLGL